MNPKSSKIMRFLIICFTVFLMGFSACSSGTQHQIKVVDEKKLKTGYAQLEKETNAPQTESVYITEKKKQTLSLPVLMAVPYHSTITDFEKTAIESVNNYLTQKNYEVKTFEGKKQLDEIIRIQQDISEQDEDLPYLASLSLGADVYIKINGKVNPHGAFIELNAYETATARLLGSQTAEVKNHGKTSPVHLIQSAAKKALPGLEKKILAYWEKDREQGVQYKIIFRYTGDIPDSQQDELQQQTISQLKKTFNQVKINIATSQTLDLLVYADSSKYEDSQEIYSKIREILQNMPNMKKQALSKKLIILELY